MTDQPEPLSTVPESAARANQCDGCLAGAPLVNGLYRMGGECYGDGVVYADWMVCQRERYEPSAPRPVPETAAQESCAQCGHPNWSVMHAGRYRHIEGGHAYEPPAPPAEPVEAQGAMERYAKFNAAFDAETDAIIEAEARGEPVEEAQRCKHCGQHEDHPVHGDDLYPGLHPFTVEVENEGARPLATLEGATERLAVWVYRSCTGSDFYKDINEKQREHWRELARPHAAVIHKEATAAHEADMDALNKVANTYAAAYNTANRYAAEQRTRAEAAEARVESAEFNARHSIDTATRLMLEAQARAEAAEGARDELLGEVREWLCEACNAVYPGPPQEGVWCVICPKCGGDTAPRGVVERRKLKAALSALVKMIDTHRAIYEYEKQQYVIDEGPEWAAARALTAESVTPGAEG